MFEWCENRLDITGKSVCLDVFQQWVVGNCTPHYRHAIQQSIQLFFGRMCRHTQTGEIDGISAVSGADITWDWQFIHAESGIRAMAGVIAKGCGAGR
ncbi:hypothetical protein DZS_12950 [Dickeya ananatis]